MSPPVSGPVSGLTDVLVHGGDIRIPLGLTFAPAPDLVSLALDFLTGFRAMAFVSFGLLRGISLRADDIGRSWGKGAELHGPAAALMMAVCGRGALLDQLDGPGLSILRNRGIR